jgi:phage anti-repressor protein
MSNPALIPIKGGDDNVNIVELVEGMPITRLTENCNNRLLSKIKQRFTEEQQKIFLASFYCYLNYDNENTFAVDFENVWKWVGFARKDHAKRLLVSCFTENIDYTCSTPRSGEGHATGRGANKQTIMMTIRTFKRFCLKADTAKGKEIHNYYLDLEKILQEVITEECIELTEKVKQHNQEIQHIQTQNTQLQVKNELDKQKLREKTILEQFPIIREPTVPLRPLPSLVEERDTGKGGVVGEPQVPLTGENFARIVDENTRLVNEKNELTNRVILLDIENKRLTTSINRIVRNNNKINQLKSTLVHTNITLQKNNTLPTRIIKPIVEPVLEHEPEPEPVLEDEPEDEPEPEEPQTDEITTYETLKKLRRIMREKDGLFHIEGKTYSKLIGTRDEVWKYIAYKTAGCLTRGGLILNKNGKLVSVSKAVQSTLNIDNHLADYAKPRNKTNIENILISKQ